MFYLFKYLTKSLNLINIRVRKDKAIFIKLNQSKKQFKIQFKGRKKLIEQKYFNFGIVGKVLSFSALK